MNKRNNHLPDTKQRILDAAEQLFAEHGIAGTSLRTITREADANLAAVHYHFGTKEDLCQAVFARRIGPVNEERLRQLDVIEAGSDVASVEAIVHAFFDPVLQMTRDLEGREGVLPQLIGRFYSEPAELVQDIVRKQFGEVGRRFVAALQRALPQLSPEEVYERFKCVVGTLSYVLTYLHGIEVLPEYSRSRDDAAMFERLCLMAVAGLTASTERAS
jgi:AcrR family transcriptional regulator